MSWVRSVQALRFGVVSPELVLCGIAQRRWVEPLARLKHHLDVAHVFNTRRRVATNHDDVGELAGADGS